MKKRVLITGGTGNLGKYFTHILALKGYKINLLSRKVFFSSHKVFKWDIEKNEIDTNVFESVDYIVHLAGESILKGRWTKSRKNKLYNSRINSTRLLYQGLKKSNTKIKAIVCASAIGYYDQKDYNAIYNEESEKGKGFVAELVHEWEESQKKLQEYCLTLVHLRIGLVLHIKSGVLKELYPIVKSYIASPIGTGKQMMNWIHIIDLGRIIIAIFNNELDNNIINAVAPNPVDNKTFITAYAKYLDRPCFMPRIPTFMMKLMYGEKAEIMTEGSKIASKVLSNSNFVFKCNQISDVFHKED